MKRHLFTVFIFCFTCTIQMVGQSYEKKYNSRKVRIDDYAPKQLGRAEAVYQSDPKQALELVEKALLHTIKNDDAKGSADAYKMLADINFDLEEYRLAYANYKKADALYISQKNNSARYNVLVNLGRSAEMENKLDESLEYYNEFLRMAKKQKNAEDKITVKNYIAGVHQKQGALEESEKHYKDVINESKKTGNTRALLTSTNQLGKIKQEQQKSEEAIGYFQQSTEIARSMEDVQGVNESYSNLSDAYRNTNNISKELEVQQEAWRFNQEVDDKISLADNNVKIANIYIETDANKEAIDRLEENYKLNQSTKNLAGQSKTMEALSRAYEKEGEKEKALQSFRQYLAQEDSINKLQDERLLARAERSQLLDNVQNKMLILEKDKELDQKTIELLQKEKKLRNEEIRRHRTINYALVGGILILLVTATLVYRSVRQKKIANQLLVLKSLRNQMNPHFIFNALNSVNNFISKSDERSANKYLSDFSRLMREVMENSQEDFIPLSSEIEILELYLKLEHFRFKDKFDYTFHVDDNLSQEDFLIPPMLIQPYIENAVWHGLRYKEDKGALAVSLEQSGQNLIVTIEDDGIGRKKSQEIKTKNQKSMKSTGLKNIDSRMKILNEIYKADLKVEVSDLDQNNETGTKVRLEISSKEASLTKTKFA